MPKFTEKVEIFTRPSLLLSPHCSSLESIRVLFPECWTLRRPVSILLFNIDWNSSKFPTLVGKFVLFDKIFVTSVVVFWVFRRFFIDSNKGISVDELKLMSSSILKFEFHFDIFLWYIKFHIRIFYWNRLNFLTKTVYFYHDKDSKEHASFMTEFLSKSRN